MMHEADLQSHKSIICLHEKDCQIHQREKEEGLHMMSQQLS